MSSEKQKYPVLLYRGVPERKDNDRLGRWWSTDPYYAYHYSNGGKGRLFVASVDETTLKTHAKDVSIDEGYENYLFPSTDPSDTRIASDEEIDALRAATTIESPDDMPGGPLIKRPDNAIEIGYAIFGPKDIGSTALSETTAIFPETEK
ncbi:MAG: hypothetical protein NVS1B7_0840 [Candidatus Saccharimonadales bacterium]